MKQIECKKQQILNMTQFQQLKKKQQKKKDNYKEISKNYLLVKKHLKEKYIFL